jgi:pyridoxal phosphate enzyme (YggS family)
VSSQTIENNLSSLKEDIARCAERAGRSPGDIRLVAVSKRFPVELIEEARRAGQIHFGENYIQEAVEKKQHLGDSVRFHFIGHLQSNKAAVAARYFDMVETIDRVKIGNGLNRRLLEEGRRLDALVQVNVGLDPKKSGVLPRDLEKLLEALKGLERLRIKGLMTMPPLTADPEEARPFFSELRQLGEQMHERGLFDSEEGFELSMGMSGDYRVAIEEGATSIRIGTAIFGMRPPRV